jgi:hypothetical protein
MEILVIQSDDSLGLCILTWTYTEITLFLYGKAEKKLPPEEIGVVITRETVLKDWCQIFWCCSHQQ